MYHEQTRSPLVGNQILLLIVLVILIIVFVAQLAFRVGKWDLTAESGVEKTKDTTGNSPSAHSPPEMLAALQNSGVVPTKRVGREGSSGHAPVLNPGADVQATTIAALKQQVDRYTVQIGAFRFKVGANQVAQAFRSKGYAVSVQAPPPGEFHLVWVGLFQDDVEAKNFARQIGTTLRDLGLDGYRVRTTRR